MVKYPERTHTTAIRSLGFEQIRLPHRVKLLLEQIEMFLLCVQTRSTCHSYVLMIIS